MSSNKEEKILWREFALAWLNSENAPPNLIKGAEKESLAPLLLKLILSSPIPVMAVFSSLADAEEAYSQLAAWENHFGLELNGLFLPEVAEGGKYMPENETMRVNAIHQALTGGINYIFASIAAAMSPIPPPEKILKSEMFLEKGMKIKYSDLLTQLVEMDYDDEFEVNIAGEFSRRGGIVDIFSPSERYPARIEFWGDEIDSIRKFSPEDQRSSGEIDAYRVIQRSANVQDDQEGIDLFAFIEKLGPYCKSAVFPEQCKSHLEKYAEDESLERWAELFDKKFFGTLFIDNAESANYPDAAPCGCFPAVAHLRESFLGEAEENAVDILRSMTAEQIKQWLDTGYSVALMGINEASEEHIAEWCEEYGVDSSSLLIDSGNLPHGIIFPEARKVFLTENEIFSTVSKRRRYDLKKESFAEKMRDFEISSMADLDEGDYAVHLLHGIGIYKGIREIKSRDSVQEMIVMEYADEREIFIPLWQAHMLSRYIGSKKGIAPLSRIGGKRWNNAKIAAKASVRQLALEMIKVQAVRASSEGYSFKEDDIVQKLFEDAFPFEDTPDQAKACEEIKKDMSAHKPMDRLLCGDVGYGKTEVAIRAAFKCVMEGKQVAVLAPTTVLAQQHLFSFAERFAEYPVIIEMLSRFRTDREQKQILARLSEGKVDIVIGTHRLVQNDVKFSNLGLVIIDEEQRFGVAHKEKLKKMRATVDMLAMTATPIPRTLYMAMAGMRDLSSIITAPGRRLPVQTIVSQHDEKIIVDALENEIQRGGQAFYLHNRVKSIESVCKKLQELIPNARFSFAHGRMHEDELESVMSDFIKGEIDVLVCTTIIESGLDIPNANTMIIERADRFGLAELYQLRGRIGRWTRQAYAYLLLPKHEIMSGDARKRIAAIRRYTHLGAGFKLALRDLEIRGSGNLLGAEQSGYINSVGFELYCQLLRSMVAELNGEKIEFLPEIDVNFDFISFGHEATTGNTAAGISPDFIQCERLRLEAYRKLSRLKSLAEIDDFANELRDRYGKLPDEARMFILVSKIRVTGARAGFASVYVRENKIFLEGGRAGRGHYKIKRETPQLKPYLDAEKKLEKTLGLLIAIENGRV